jgi:SAM-dependent methyltransferase
VGYADGVKLNAVERMAVNSFARDVLLRRTMGWLHDAACAPPLGRVLEVGCGQGSGGREIRRRFGPQALDGFDLDPAQVARARARVPGARLWVGDAERIGAGAGAYDAVFELAILHHVPGWRTALGEIRRVLRPGGLFLFEELSRELFFDLPVVSALLRRYTVHPWDAMFDFPTFRRGLADAGLRLVALRTEPVPGWHVGVAVRD